ncbi:transposase [Pseudanabaenaceae cyanobacterium LEGE 13415]|nr:transposase [Pseudanabaenaceae cyanobacterium LEGE 13415]
MVTRRQTFRLYPNKAQEKALFDARRLHCYLYNACISHRQTEYKLGNKSVDYYTQQNALPAFKKDWVEFAALNSQSLQGTVKRVDLAYQSFFSGMRGKPKLKSIRNYSGWGYPGRSGWKATTEGHHGTLTLNDLGITLKMRGQAKDWATPGTLMIVFKPSKRQWFASFTVEVSAIEAKFGSESDLKYESIAAYDLGTETALTLFDGTDFETVENPRLSHKNDEKVRKAAKQKRRKRAPKKGSKASRRWKKINKRESSLKAKVARQRKDWQHKVTSDIASRYDIGVTEKLSTKGMTHSAKKGSCRKKQKAGLNKSILSVGFGTLNKMITYKIEQKGGLVLQLPTRIIKPSQRCPKCNAVHKEWAELKNRHHACPDCGFEIPRDRGSAMVMYNVATNQQPGFGTSLVSLGCFSSTSETRKTGSMKQLGQKKRQKSSAMAETGVLETPSAYAVG